MKSSILHYLIPLPFVAFLFGYFFICYFHSSTTQKVPHLIGLVVHDALVKLSEQSLNGRIIFYKEAADLPHGTILSQNPIAGTKVRAHHAVLLSVSKAPDRVGMPNLIHKKLAEIEIILKPLNLTYSYFYLPSSAPAGNCFSQSPCPGAPLDTNQPVTIYLSASITKLHVMPNFKEIPLEKAVDLLNKYHVKYEVTHLTSPRVPSCKKRCVVVDQRPIAGSFVYLDGERKTAVQLQVEDF